MTQEGFSTLKAKIVGSTKEGVWAQVATLNNLQVVLVLSGGEVRQLGRELLSFLEGEDQNLQKKNLAELGRIAQKLKEKIPSEIQFCLILALPVGRVLYLKSVGGAVFLKRKESLEKVISGEESASGFLETGDLLILGSEQFFEVASPQFLTENLDHFSPSEIAERIAPKVSSREDNAACAALILSFQKKEENWSEAVEEKIREGEVPEAPTHSFWTGFFKKLKLPRISWRPQVPRSFYLPSEEPEAKGKRTVLTVAILLITLLAASVFFGINKTRETEETRKFEALIQGASFKYEEGKGLVGLNDALARQRLNEAKGQIEEIKKTLSLSRDQEKKLQELEKGVGENLVTLSRVYKLGALPLFWDASLIKEGSEGESLAIFEDKIAILDKKNRLVYLLSGKTKAVSFLGGEDLKDEVKLLGFHGENVYLLTEKGIVQLNTRSKKSQLAVEKDREWGDLTSLVAYGGNLYLLDRKSTQEGGVAGQIWKYIGTETGFSAKKSYLVPDIRPDFSQAKEMTIDGSVWVLLSGQISKFTSGRPDSFVISGLEGDFGNPEFIFTNEKSNYLYLLDHSNKKILVLGKDGAYQAQYEAEEISQARDMVVLEEEKKIFLLTGSKVYYLELKQ